MMKSVSALLILAVGAVRVPVSDPGPNAQYAQGNIQLHSGSTTININGGPSCLGQCLVQLDPATAGSKGCSRTNIACLCQDTNYVSTFTSCLQAYCAVRYYVRLERG